MNKESWVWCGLNNKQIVARDSLQYMIHSDNCDTQRWISCSHIVFSCWRWGSVRTMNPLPSQAHLHQLIELCRRCFLWCRGPFDNAGMRRRYCAILNAASMCCSRSNVPVHVSMIVDPGPDEYPWCDQCLREGHDGYFITQSIENVLKKKENKSRDDLVSDIGRTKGVLPVQWSLTHARVH